MILSDDLVEERMQSPLNLINRLRPTVMSKPAQILTIPPTADQIIDDLDKKLDTSSSNQLASDILNESLSVLKGRIALIEKPEKLANIALTAGRIIRDIKETNRGQQGNNVQVIVYQPSVSDESRFSRVVVEQ